jgi:hypothetical protein
MEQILKDCIRCNPFIATNQDEVLNIMKNLEDQDVKKWPMNDDNNEVNE